MERRISSNHIKYAIILFIQYGFSAHTASTDCTFDHNLCGWTQDMSDDFDWTRENEDTPTKYTGPNSDHTTGGMDGYYIYIEADHQKDGDIARLISPMQEEGPHCLMFWYSMHGKHVGTLNVYLEPNDTALVPNDTVILTKSENLRSGKWWSAAIPYVAQARYQIVIEGIRGQGGIRGDIAVDDISITQGTCIGCSFDSGLCLWKQDDNDDFDWKWWKGKTTTSGTGPPADHTSGHGHYIYIDTSGKRPNQRARVISPLQDPGKYCFSFWYYMHGKHVDTLRAFIEDEQQNSTDYFKIVGEKGERWIQKVDLIQPSFKFRIIIEGKVYSSHVSPYSLGDIAIDDVMLLSCPDCQNPLPRHGKTNSTIFQYGTAIKITCNSGFYIRGNSTIICQPGGVWSASPTCEPVDCQNPLPRYGKTNSTIFQYGTAIEITCNSGFYIRGNSTIICQPGGVWSASPTCEPVDSDDEDDNLSIILYVLIPVVSVAVVVTLLLAIIWRQKVSRCFVTRTVNEEQNMKGQSRPRSLISDVTYPSHQHARQLNATSAISQDTAGAVMMDDINGKEPDKNPVYYSTADAMNTERDTTENRYGPTKPTATSVFQNTYSHVSGDPDKCSFESSYDTTSFPSPRNQSLPKDKQTTDNSYDILNFKQSKHSSGTKLPPGMQSEQDLVYDHAGPGAVATDYAESDNYSHLNK